MVGVGVNRHNKGGFLQAKSQLGRSSYHVNLAFCGHGGQLNVSGGRLDGLILGQETSSINQTNRNKKMVKKCSSSCVFRYNTFYKIICGSYIIYRNLLLILKT